MRRRNSDEINTYKLTRPSPPIHYNFCSHLGSTASQRDLPTTGTTTTRAHMHCFITPNKAEAGVGVPNTLLSIAVVAITQHSFDNALHTYKPAQFVHWLVCFKNVFCDAREWRLFYGDFISQFRTANNVHKPVSSTWCNQCKIQWKLSLLLT